MGLLDVQEPFANLFTQGMITRDGAKMSKSKGNTVSPAEYVERYGADTARTYICFMGPPDQGRRLDRRGRRGRPPLPRRASGGWPRRSPSGPSAGGAADAATPSGDARELLAKAHWAIDKVTRDFEPRFQFNTAIAAVMELVNEVYRLKDGLYGDPAGDAARPLRHRHRRLADLPLRARTSAPRSTRRSRASASGSSPGRRPTRRCSRATRSRSSSR